MCVCMKPSIPEEMLSTGQLLCNTAGLLHNSFSIALYPLPHRWIPAQYAGVLCHPVAKAKHGTFPLWPVSTTFTQTKDSHTMPICLAQS